MAHLLEAPSEPTLAAVNLVEFESDDGFGWEAGGGVSIPFAPTLSFTPGVRYRTHSADFSASENFEGGDLTVSYIVVDLGLKLGI